MKYGVLIVFTISLLLIRIYKKHRRREKVIVKASIAWNLHFILAIVSFLIVIDYIVGVATYLNRGNLVLTSKYIVSFYDIWNKEYLKELVDFFRENNMKKYHSSVIALQIAISRIYQLIIWLIISIESTYLALEKNEICEDGVYTLTKQYKWNKIRKIVWGEKKIINDSLEYQELSFRMDSETLILKISKQDKEKVHNFFRKELPKKKYEYSS
jgi:hypothetical protein